MHKNILFQGIWYTEGQWPQPHLDSPYHRFQFYLLGAIHTERLRKQHHEQLGSVNFYGTIHI